MNAKNPKNIRWIHQISLPDGTTTPGIWPPRYEEYGLTRIQFKGKRVLDIGCLDGLYSFYAEKRGAREVVSIDINEEQFGKQTNTKTDWSKGYLTAHKLLNSKAKYIFPYSVYDLNKEELKQFDVVLFLGVIYHIAHPLLALERINEVVNTGGVLVLEAEISEYVTRFAHKENYKEPSTFTVTAKDAEHTQKSPILLKLIRTIINAFLYVASDTKEFNKRLHTKIRMVSGKLLKPFLFKGQEGIYKDDSSNRWILSIEDLERLVDFAGFKIITKIHNPYSSRVTLICKKMKPFPPSYADKSPYRDFKKRVSNMKHFSYH